MVSIGTSTEVTLELRPQGQEGASPGHCCEGTFQQVGKLMLFCVVPHARQFKELISSGRWCLFSSCSQHIMEGCRNDCPKKAIYTFHYASISTSLELFISSSPTTSSQDLSGGWSGLQFRVPKALSEHKCIPRVPDFITHCASVCCRHISDV